jgi:hypothetical protein
LQLSPVVQAFPSLHARPTTTECEHPVAGLHESSVHPFPSSQLAGTPAPHWPAALQLSPVVQAFPSLHARPTTTVCAQPVAGLHESSVHAFPSLQFAAAPGTHTPAMLQLSPVVQAFASLHARPGTP